MKHNEFRKEMNFRDMGGYRNREGRILKEGIFFRSGGPYQFTEQEMAALKRLNIRFVMDFRTRKEWDEKPDPVFEDALVVRHSGLESEGGREIDFSPEGMRQIGAEGRSQLAKLRRYYQLIPFSNEAMKVFFKAIREDNVPMLFHCASGKDRTGVAAILLMALLGYDEDTIIQDYLLSNQYYSDMIADAFNNSSTDFEKNPEARTLLQMLYGVSEEIGRAVYHNVLDRYGSFENYFLAEHELTLEDIADIRNRYLL